MTQREYDRYIVEFPATFTGDTEGVGIVYNLGLGGCKIVTDRPLEIGAMLVMYLKVPEQTFAITIRQATVRWMMPYEFGVEFLGIEELERNRLAQFLQRLNAAAA
ncbi:PilZ domain-containing protein [Petrachloros mirabilis]